METSGGDVIASALKKRGTRHIFTLCGGHISPILVGCRRAGIAVIDVRDEVNAVFAADAAARLTGLPGVAAVTAGPGVTNTITALKNAQMAQSPMILIGGAAATFIKGRGSLQDIDIIPMLDSVVKMAVSINRNCDIVPALDRAFTVAQSDVPGPVFLECPIDLLYGEEIVRQWYGKASGVTQSVNLKSKLFQFYLARRLDRMFACDFDETTLAEWQPIEYSFDASKVKKAAQTLNRSRKPVLIVGSQAMLNPGESTRLAQAVAALGIPTYLTGMARGLLGAVHSVHMRHHRKQALQSADLVLVAGMPCDFRLGYGRSIGTEATLVSVNRSKADLNLNRKPDIGILSDPHQFLCALAEQKGLDPGIWHDWLETLLQADRKREQQIDTQSAEATAGINPLRFFRILDRFLEPESVIVADGGDFVATASYILRPRSPLSWLDPGVFGTLGVGAGFALGAGLCRPQHDIWLIYGDGAAGYSLQEFDTFVRHGIPVIAIVGNDGSWAQIARDQVEILRDDVGTVLRRTDYHRVVEGFGGKGFLLDQEEDIETVLEAALETARKGTPVLINAMIGKTDFRKGSLSM